MPEGIGEGILVCLIGIYVSVDDPALKGGYRTVLQAFGYFRLATDAMVISSLVMKL